MKYVLFVCTQNAGRSQMAQAFFEHYALPDLRAESAGLEPADHIHPVVVEAMREVQIDLSDRRPKKLSVEMQLHADLAVTMGCGGRCPYMPTAVEDWEVDDPADRPIEEVRVIRDEIAGLVEDLVLERVEEIRADGTAHSVRLAGLLPTLIQEFDGSRNPEEIRACADAILSRYDDVPVRSHVLTLAQRRTRECLRAETCCELADTK
jgi:arsenate reductase (thioredoxin)